MTIDKETETRIIRYHFVEQWRVGTIACKHPGPVQQTVHVVTRFAITAVSYSLGKLPL